MPTDRYTRFILTIIAVALLGINLSFCRVTEGQLDRGYIRMGTK
jgi:hypothetical protein